MTHFFEKSKTFGCRQFVYSAYLLAQMSQIDKCKHALIYFANVVLRYQSCRKRQRSQLKIHRKYRHSIGQKPHNRMRCRTGKNRKRTAKVCAVTGTTAKTTTRCYRKMYGKIVKWGMRFAPPKNSFLLCSQRVTPKFCRLQFQPH